MINKSRVYSSRKENMYAGLLLLLLVLTALGLPLLPYLQEGVSVAQGKLVGFFGFVIVAILITVIPLLFKIRLEDGDESIISTYFAGFKIKEINKKNVISLQRGNVLRGGLGAGKALHVKVKGKYYTDIVTFGVTLYGEKAISDIEEVLSTNE